jgi:hypothetical protein
MLGFSTPDFALVAYAEVFGTDGNSTTMNSGIGTSRVSPGVYALVLPTNLQQLDNLSQIYVQTRGVIPCWHTVDDGSPQVKGVRFSATGTPNMDTSFSVTIWRSVITPPASSPS